MLSVDSIAVAYDGVPAVHDVSFEVDEGDVVAIVGANGAGKTTTLKTVAGAKHPTSGSISFEGENITDIDTPGVVERGITYVPEDRGIFEPLTVEQNLKLGSYTVDDDRVRDETMEEVFELFPRLDERRSQKAGTMSGGEQQMVAIARGLMSRPKLLMLDEPSTGLMPKLVDTVIDMVTRLNEETDQTILLVEQNVQRALEIADYAYLMQTGRTIDEGTGEEVLDSDHLEQAYFGMETDSE